MGDVIAGVLLGMALTAGLNWAIDKGEGGLCPAAGSLNWLLPPASRFAVP